MNTDPVKHRIGRRGAALLILGIIWALSGVQDLLHHPGYVPGARLYSAAPWWLQAAGWIITGVIACWSAFQRQGRDWIGWVAVYVMAVFAGAVYVDMVVEAVGTPGLRDAILAGIRNYAFIGLIFVLSGWREPITFDTTDTADREAD